MNKDNLHYSVIDAVIRMSRGGTEGVGEASPSPRDSGIGSGSGKLGRKPAGDHGKAAELESVKTKGRVGGQWCRTAGKCKEEQSSSRKPSLPC